MTSRRKRVRDCWAIGACLVLLASVGAACGDDADDVGDVGDDPPTTTATTASTDPTTPSGGSGIVWPADGSDPLDDPIAAVTAFAVDFVGFVDPIVSDLRPGSPSTVDVRPAPNGPVTTVLLEQPSADAGWVVVGAGTPNIQPTEPAAHDEVSSPLRLGGASTAFEGAVGVTVRDLAGGAPLAESYVTGGTMGELGPFEGTLDFTDPSTSDGSVMLYTVSPDDGGGVWEASVVSVEFEGSS